MRQPGMAASTLALIFLSLIFVIHLAHRLGRGQVPDNEGFSSAGVMIRAIANTACPFIVGGWIGLLLFGRLRRERGWIDGFGILVGIFWSVTTLMRNLRGIWSW
jgi:hypothetical protein